MGMPISEVSLPLNNIGCMRRVKNLLGLGILFLVGLYMPCIGSLNLIGECIFYLACDWLKRCHIDVEVKIQSQVGVLKLAEFHMLSKHGLRFYDMVNSGWLECHMTFPHLSLDAIILSTMYPM